MRKILVVVLTVGASHQSRYGITCSAALNPGAFTSFEPFEGQDMGLCEVTGMDIVANTSPIWCIVIGPENRNRISI